MGLCLARGSRMAGNEPGASITWREYAAALSEAVEPADAWVRGGPFGPRGPSPGGEAQFAGGGESAARRLEIALRLVRRRARRAVGLVDILQLQCEAARLRLQLMQLYVRLGDVDRARALARETQAVL